MYMRLVHMKLEPRRILEFVMMYEKEIVPELQRMTGCLYAGLIRSVSRDGEGISLTLWDTRDHAESYEQSGVFARLLEKARPFSAYASEWKVRLSDDMQLEYVPVDSDPVVTSHPVTSFFDPSMLDRSAPGTMHLRLVSVHVRAGMEDTFRALYRDLIVPALKQVKGCRYALLMDTAEDPSEMISLTIWDSRDDAAAYDSGGLFDDLLEKVKHTFTGLYRWKMQLRDVGDGGKGDRAAHTVTSDDPTVRDYVVVTGKAFH